MQVSYANVAVQHVLLTNGREKKSVNKRDAFLTGSTSTCRGHIRQHYDIYLERCKKENLQPHQYAMP